jgi:hypothetical protein
VVLNPNTHESLGVKLVVFCISTLVNFMHKQLDFIQIGIRRRACSNTHSFFFTLMIIVTTVVSAAKKSRFWENGLLSPHFVEILSRSCCVRLVKSSHAEEPNRTSREEKIASCAEGSLFSA